MEEARVPEKTSEPAASQSQSLSHNTLP